MMEELLEPGLHILQLQLPVDHEHSGLPLVVESLVMGQHWLRLAVESDQPLGDHLLSVIQPPAGLAPVQQPLHHHLVARLDVGQQDDRDFLPHHLLPDIDVLLVAGEAVHHHRPALPHGQDRLLELLDHDLAGHHLALLHPPTDLLRLLRPRLQVLPQDVPH